MHLNISPKAHPKIPSVLILAQCAIFVLLYSVWMLYELMFFRRIALIGGALLAIYPIFQYRSMLLQKRAIASWLLVGAFLWALFHLLFLSQDFPAQLMELRRIWKYAGLGAIFALGLGLSLARVCNQKQNPYWPVIYLGFCMPLIIYMIKGILTTYGPMMGISPPAFLKINFDGNSAYYIPKTDYIAFCLPVLALSLGQILDVLSQNIRLRGRQYLGLGIYFLVVGATLFLFIIQNTKNGIAYAAMCIALFMVKVLSQMSAAKFWYKLALMIAVIATLFVAMSSNFQKNDSWRTLIADTKIGFDLEHYPHWKFAGEQGYPNNEFGKTVSVTNYERASWFKVGSQLAVANPLGYGLVEDSFKRLVKLRWPEASNNLSHSHSGWLDLLLGVGLPGFLCILLAMVINIRQSLTLPAPYKTLVFWPLLASMILWITTEVATTTSFSALIFWIALSCGMTLIAPKDAISK